MGEPPLAAQAVPNDHLEIEEEEEDDEVYNLEDIVPGTTGANVTTPFSTHQTAS